MHGIRVVGLSVQHLPVTRLRLGQLSRLVMHDGYAKERRNVRRNGRDIRIAPNPKLGGSAASMAVHGRIFWQKDLPSSLVQLRIAVWTGVTRDTKPKSVMACAMQHCCDPAAIPDPAFPPNRAAPPDPMALQRCQGKKHKRLQP